MSFTTYGRAELLWDPKWQQQVHDRQRMAEWQAILLDAANFLENRGWCQGRLSTRDGYCAAGAIMEVSFPFSNYDPVRIFEEYVGEPLAQWNDTPGRTKEQVIFALRDCALNGAE